MDSEIYFISAMYRIQKKLNKRASLSSTQAGRGVQLFVAQ